MCEAHIARLPGGTTILHQFHGARHAMSPDHSAAGFTVIIITSHAVALCTLISTYGVSMYA